MQIVENLLSNAIKYTPAGNGGIELHTARRGGEAVLRVRDAGIGIAPEMLPRVWDLFSLLLTLWGHDVHTTHDGPAALAEAAAFRPEIVILDIGLPRMDGHEVARRLRSGPAFGRMVLIALSGYGTDEDRRQSQAAGIDAHLVKPVEPDALRALIAGL